MELGALAIRRLIAQRALALTMIATFAFTGGTLVAGPIYAAGAEQAIVYGHVERAPAISRDLIATITTPPGFNIADASARLRGLLSPFPVASVAFQERSSVLQVSSASGSTTATIAYRDGLLPQVGLIDGRFPVAPDEVLLPQSVAGALRATPGDSVSLRYSSSATVRVAGVYASIPSGAALIVGGTLTSVADDVLPVLTTSAGFTAVVGAAGQRDGIHVAWDVAPEVRGLALPGLVSLAALEGRVAQRASSAMGASVTSNLSTLIPGARREVAQSRAPIYLVVFQVALVGLGVAIGLGSLKLRRQQFELSILKTRGARTGFLVGVQAAELVLTGALGWLFALGVGMLLAVVARAAHGPGAAGAPFGLSIGTSPELMGLAGISFGALVLLVLAFPHIRRSVVDERREVSRERKPAWLRLPTEVLPLALGFVALMELRRRGLQPSGDKLDPLVLVAPTLLLLGGSLLSVRLLFSGFERAEPFADRTGAPAAFLAVHSLARSSANMSLMLLLVLSTGLFAFSSSLRSTVIDHNTNAARGSVGADWNVLVPLPAAGIGAASRLPAGTTLIFKAPVSTAGDPRLSSSTVIGVEASSYASGGWWRSNDSSVSLTELLARLDAPAIGVPLPVGASSLELTVSAPTPAPRGVHLWIPLADANGVVRDVDLGALRAGSRTYTAPIGGSVRALSVMLAAPDPAPLSLVHTGRFTVTFDRFIVVGANSSNDVGLSGWTGLQSNGLIVRTEPAPAGGLQATLIVAGGGPIGGIAPREPPLPAVVGRSAAGTRGPVELRIGDAGVPVKQVGIMRGFPAVSTLTPPVMVPLAALVQRFDQILRTPNGGTFVVLAMGSADPTRSIRSAGFIVGTVTSAADIEALLATSPQNLALGMEFAAGIAGAALAVFALGLALFFGAQRRRYELSSLRALGGRPRHAVIALGLESGLILLPALLLGSLMGTVLLNVVLTDVSPPGAGTGTPALVIDWAGVVLAATGACLTLGVALAVTGRQMGSDNASGLLRGEPG